MPLDSRWKFPQGKSPEHLYDALYQLIRELRKGEKSVANFLQFPADQIPSSNPNALDDYEEGSWPAPGPTLTFETPGDLNVVYSVRNGTYTKIGRLVAAHFTIVTSTFTHGTAAGDCQITGLPFANAGGVSLRGFLHWQGITKANYTHLTVRVPNAASLLVVEASGSVQPESDVSAANMPTGGTVILAGTVIYITS